MIISKEAITLSNSQNLKLQDSAPWIQDLKCQQIILKKKKKGFPEQLAYKKGEKPVSSPKKNFFLDLCGLFDSSEKDFLKNLLNKFSDISQKGKKNSKCILWKEWANHKSKRSEENV